MDSQTREKEYLDKIDCKFPYEDVEKGKALVDEAIAISPNAVFGVLEELARPGVNIPKDHIRQNVAILMNYLKTNYSHPFKDKALAQAQSLFDETVIPAETVIEKMREVAQYPGQYCLLNLYYFTPNNDMEAVDKTYKQIVDQWQDIRQPEM